MDKILEWLFTIWEKVGWHGQIIIILFLILVMVSSLTPSIIEFFKFIQDLLKNIKNNFGFKNKKLVTPIKSKTTQENSYVKEKYQIIEDIKNHDLMNEINIIKTKLNDINFGDKKKNKIFKSIIIIQMENIKKHVFNLIETYNVDELENNKFRKIIFDMLTEISNDTNKELRFELGDEIYDLVLMDPIKGVRNWGKNNDDRTWILIEQFCNLNYIKYNHDRLLFILTSLSTSLIVIFNGLEKKFSSFNGELDNLIKKNNWS